jgi:hypothetical protein
MAEIAHSISEEEAQEDSHHLYRHFDKTGKLLYVGVSLHATVRLLRHRTTSHWFDNISTITIESFPSRSEAIFAERRAIRLEQPLHNKAHVFQGDYAHPFDDIDKAHSFKRGGNKTIYVSDEDLPTWDEASRMLRFYHNKSLSAFILEKVREYVKEEQARQEQPAKGSENGS